MSSPRRRLESRFGATSATRKATVTVKERSSSSILTVTSHPKPTFSRSRHVRANGQKFRAEFGADERVPDCMPIQRKLAGQRVTRLLAFPAKSNKETTSPLARRAASSTPTLGNKTRARWERRRVKTLSGFDSGSAFLLRARLSSSQGQSNEGRVFALVSSFYCPDSLLGVRRSARTRNRTRTRAWTRIRTSRTELPIVQEGRSRTGPPKVIGD
jgi:hypothetical protein